MASRLIALLNILGSRGIATTSTAPNSWAIICLWRRFFEAQEREISERADEFIAALQEAEAETTPIAYPHVVQARIDFSRLSRQGRVETPSSTSAPSHLNAPDLRVPVEDGEWQYLAQ